MKEMRRWKQKLSDEKVAAILKKATSGVLALNGDYPYAVPLSYVYEDGIIYFHCAKTGLKIDLMKQCDKVSFCVIDQDEIIAEKYTTYFRSVIVFGKLKAALEPVVGLKKLAMKYSSAYEEGIMDEINGALAHVLVLELHIEKMSGKEAIELVNLGK